MSNSNEEPSLNPARPSTLKRALFWAVVAAAAADLSLSLVGIRHIPTETAAQVIAAEAAAEGLPAMIAVGEVIRRRGGMSGFSVMSKDLPAFFKAQRPGIRFAARTAWGLSRLRALSGGATHFENVREFGEPWWSRDMKRTAGWGGLVFYKK